LDRRFVRVECRDPNRDWSPFFIDVLVDDQNKIVGGPPACGWWGKARSEEAWPFVAWANRDGEYTLDFGEWNEESRESRYRALSLPSGPLKKGASVSFPEEEGCVELAVYDVTDIGKQQSIF
jgi:hypothetical protein